MRGSLFGAPPITNRPQTRLRVASCRSMTLNAGMTQTLPIPGRQRRIGLAAGIPLGAAGITAAAFGFTNNEDRWVVIGAALAVLAGMAFCTMILVDTAARFLQPAADAYSLGCQVGYDRGYIEGRHVGRPNLVPNLEGRRIRTG